MERTIIMLGSLGLLLVGCGATATVSPSSGDQEDEQPSFGVLDARGAYDSDSPIDSGGAADSNGAADFAGAEDTSDSPEVPDIGPSEDAPISAQPNPVQPCASAECWDTSLQPQPCYKAGVAEDYSTGKYNVHRYASVAHADTLTTIRLTRTGGQWQPALMVTRKDGSVLSDGETGATSPGLEVEVIDTGLTSDVASVVVQSDQTLTLDVYVTGWSVVDSGFIDDLPTDSTYELDIDSVCDDPPAFSCADPIINGNPVAEPACGWLHHIGTVVVPQLAGSEDERLDIAAPVAWWALKEGVMFLQNPIVYSNCNFDSGDQKIGPLETCEPGHAWQVGLSGVQVPTFALDVLNQTAADLFPGTSTDEILAETAGLALLAPDQVAAVVASTGLLRRSWLLRNSPIGFTVQVDRVVKECVEGSKGWCYGTGWTSTALYAPDKASAIKAIADIRALLQQLGP